jgi:hypothetical protein
MMVAPVRSGAEIETEKPRPLFAGRYVSGVCCAHSYDVAPDGQRFVMAKGTPESEQRVTVELNAFGASMSSRGGAR